MRSKYVSYPYFKTPKRKNGKKNTAALLSLVLIVSMCAVAIPSVMAAETAFSNNETIYLDTSGFTGWEDSSAVFKAYTFYADNTAWNVENNSDTDLYTNAKLLNAITLTAVTDHIWKMNIPNGNVAVIQFLRLSADGTTCWNQGPMLHASAKGSNNSYKITGWTAASWSTYSTAPVVHGKEYDAIPDSSITGNDNLYQIDATFFDYYENDEITKGWRNIDYSTTHGDWEPYATLNNALAQYATANSVSYPLYFGNFYNKSDGYTGVGSSAMVNFKNIVNNSAGLNNKYYGSVVGLTSPTLNNKVLDYFGSLSGSTETAGASMPLFNKDWLVNNGYGTVVNTKFPMRTVTDASGNTSYEFDSSNAKDNIWFGNYDQTNLSVSYGAGTSNGVKDALYYYSSPKANSGYGFFPFDKAGTAAGTNKDEALDFGFGMRVDVEFNVAQNGLLNDNVKQTFNFTGDDDVWVYVDGVLVLDLGGDHKMASGTIDFNSLMSSVSTGTQSLESVTRNGTFPTKFGTSGTEAFNNQDTTVKHTLTMFYMERGMVESNLKFGFNISPVGNEFKSEKQVDTTNINAGIKDAVASADQFGFTHSYSDSENGTYTASAGKTYTYAHNGTGSSKTTPAAGTYSLYDNDTADFVDQFDTGNWFTVAESAAAAHLSYTTSWKAVDLVRQAAGSTDYTIAEGTGTDSKFKFLTLDSDSPLNATKVGLTYTNTPKTGSVNISKKVLDYQNNEITDDTTDFDATVTVSLDGGTTYKAYPLEYTINGDTTVYTMSAAGALASGAKLREGRTLNIANLPVGAIVKVQEKALSGYTFDSASGIGVTKNSTGGYFTVADTAKTMEITNKKDAPGEISVTPTAVKELTGAALTDSAFSFIFADENMNTLATVTCAQNGAITFPKQTYTDAGTHSYYFWEVNAGDSDINYDTQKFKVVVTVTNTANVLSSNVVYYKVTGEDPETLEQITDANLPAKFANSVQTGTVNVLKEAQDSSSAGTPGTLLPDTAFALYKVTGDGAAISGTPYKTAVTGDGNNGTELGKAIFSDVQIYTDDASYSTTAAHTYQWYCLVETNPKTGFTLNSTKTYFQLPVTADGTKHYDVTYSYINGKILSPLTSGNGIFGFLQIGCIVLVTAAGLMGAYVLFIKKNSKKRRFTA